MTNRLALVRGKHIEYLEAAVLRRNAASYDRVMVDVGTGDGKFVYRRAIGNDRWLCIGVDANADSLRQSAMRARRRGRVPNALFVRAPLEELPNGLEELADEIHVNLPWGSLLHAVLGRRIDDLRSIARIGKRGARLHAVVNVSALEDP